MMIVGMTAGTTAAGATKRTESIAANNCHANQGGRHDCGPSVVNGTMEPLAKVVSGYLLPHSGTFSNWNCNSSTQTFASGSMA